MKANSIKFNLNQFNIYTIQQRRLTGQSPSWQANNHLATQEILYLLYNSELPAQPQNFGSHLLSAVHNCLFSIFTDTLHIERPSPPSAIRGRVMPWWQGPT